MQKRPMPLAKGLGAVNPGTAGAIRQLPPHRGATAKSSKNGAALQALANIASKRRVGQGRRLTERSAHLGKSLPAHVGLNDHDGDE